MHSSSSASDGVQASRGKFREAAVDLIAGSLGK